MKVVELKEALTNLRPYHEESSYSCVCGLCFVGVDGHW